jgi:hypothetical protein
MVGIENEIGEFSAVKIGSEKEQHYFFTAPAMSNKT